MENNGHRLAKFGGILGGGAFITAACCFLPLMLMAAGAGTGLVALVGKASALALPLIGISVLFLIAGWWVAVQKRAPMRVRLWLGTGTVLTVLAALIVINETAVVNYTLERI